MSKQVSCCMGTGIVCGSFEKMNKKNEIIKNNFQVLTCIKTRYKQGFSFKMAYIKVACKFLINCRLGTRIL